MNMSTIDALLVVIEKQKVKIDALTEENEKLKTEMSIGCNEYRRELDDEYLKKVLKRVDALEKVVEASREALKNLRPPVRREEVKDYNILKNIRDEIEALDQLESDL